MTCFLIGMAVEGVLGVPEGVLVELGRLGLWIQTLGIVVVLWIIFQLINFFINRKRIREIYNIKKDMVRIENKIDKILSKKL